MIDAGIIINPTVLAGLSKSMQDFAEGTGKSMASVLAKTAKTTRYSLYDELTSAGNRRGEIIEWAKAREWKNIKGKDGSRSTLLAQERVQSLLGSAKGAYFRRGNLANGQLATPVYKSKPKRDGSFRRVLMRAPSSVSRIDPHSRLITKADLMQKQAASILSNTREAGYAQGRATELRRAQEGRNKPISASRIAKAASLLQRSNAARAQAKTLQQQAAAGQANQRTIHNNDLVWLNRPAVLVLKIIQAREAAHGFSALGFKGFGKQAQNWSTGAFPDVKIITAAGKSRPYVVGSVQGQRDIADAAEGAGVTIVLENLAPGAAVLARRTGAVDRALFRASYQLKKDLDERMAKQTAAFAAQIESLRRSLNGLN